MSRRSFCNFISGIGSYLKISHCTWTYTRIYRGEMIGSKNSLNKATAVSTACNCMHNHAVVFEVFRTVNKIVF